MSKIRKATGQRIGQLISNAYVNRYCRGGAGIDLKAFQDWLFYTEDKDLIKLVQAYIKTLEVK